MVREVESTVRIKTSGLVGDTRCLAPEQNPRSGGFWKRMKGLEPSTFCMASASDRSRPFAPVRSTRCLQDLCPSERTRANPSERRTLPFLPRPVRRRRPPFRLAGHPGPSALELLAAIVDVHPRVTYKDPLATRPRANRRTKKHWGGSLARSAEDPAPPSPYRSYATAATVTASGPRECSVRSPGRDRGAASSRLSVLPGTAASLGRPPRATSHCLSDRGSSRGHARACTGVLQKLRLRRDTHCHGAPAARAGRLRSRYRLQS
jgi:hypothetical protein